MKRPFLSNTLALACSVFCFIGCATSSDEAGVTGTGEGAHEDFLTTQPQFFTECYRNLAVLSRTGVKSFRFNQLADGSQHFVVVSHDGPLGNTREDIYNLASGPGQKVFTLNPALAGLPVSFPETAFVGADRNATNSGKTMRLRVVPVIEPAPQVGRWVFSIVGEIDGLDNNISVTCR